MFAFRHNDGFLVILIICGAQILLRIVTIQGVSGLYPVNHCQLDIAWQCLAITTRGPTLVVRI